MTLEYQVKKFEKLNSLDGISDKTMIEHYKLYEAYVKKANEIQERIASVDLSTANQTYSDFRELKVELSFALGGIRNHEIYFGHLGGSGGQPHGWLKKAIDRDFGSFENWQKDMKATGLSARGWAWLVYDWETKKLYNHLGDSQNTYALWYTTPLVALDTYEHAYWLDFGTNRGAYIDKFFANLDWEKIEDTIKELEIDQ